MTAPATAPRPATRVAIVAAATVGLGAAIWWCAESFGWQSPVFAALANWCVVACVAVTSTAVRWRLPVRMHAVRPWERDGAIYRRLGVGLFGRLVRRTPLRQLSPTLYLRGQRERLSSVLEGTNGAEAAHWWAAAAALLLPLFAVAREWWVSSAWLLGFNLLFNVYPALLQRLTRVRLTAALRLTRTRHSPEGQ